MGATTAIELEGLTRRYGERVALADLTLSLPAGATLVVFGPNGAGKTTLLRVLATLLRPHAGTARILGSALPDEGWQVRGRIGLLSHAPLLYRDLTGRENLEFHAQLHRVGPERVRELLERVRLVARAEDKVHTYSRGMVQRLAVCRAVSGIRDGTLIVNFPGSPKAVEECFGVLEVVLPHAVRTLRGESRHGHA